MLAKAIEASLGDSHGPSVDHSTQRHPLVDFIISPIEKENIQLFGELMTRLSGSRDATRDPELEKLAVEMHSMHDKLRYAYNKDPLVPFPGDITKTISMLEDALAKWSRIPTSPKGSPVQEESSSNSNKSNLSNGPNDSKYNPSAFQGSPTQPPCCIASSSHLFTQHAVPNCSVSSTTNPWCLSRSLSSPSTLLHASYTCRIWSAHDANDDAWAIHAHDPSTEYRQSSSKCVNFKEGFYFCSPGRDSID